MKGRDKMNVIVLFQKLLSKKLKSTEKNKNFGKPSDSTKLKIWWVRNTVSGFYRAISNWAITASGSPNK